MASHATINGTIKYAAEDFRYVLFPGDVTSKIVSKHVLTSDGRGVKWVEHTLTVSGWLYNTDLVSSTGTVDDAFAQARKILSQAGGILTIQSKGFGNYVINQNTGLGRDLKWGPIPKMISWEPIGNVTCKFEWEVTFTLPWKDTAYTRGRILDYTWETSYEYDSEGYCTRTINAELEIAGSRLIPGFTQVEQVYDIENYVLNVLCTCPVGWRRKGHSFTISKDKTKATLNYQDESDKGFPFYPGIADMDVTHEMSAETQKQTLSSWIWAISVQATPQAQFPAAYGYEACLAAHQSRFGYLIRNLINSNGSIVPIPVHFKISERVRTRTTSLTAVWMINCFPPKNSADGTGVSSPVDILVRSGMWQPFPWTSRQAFDVSNSQLGPNRTGGFSKLLSDPRQNIIMDVSSVIPRVPDIGLAEGNQPIVRKPNEDTLIQSPYGTYIEFRVWVVALVEGGQWVNFPLEINASKENSYLDKQWTQDIGGYNNYHIKGVIVRVGLPPSAIPEIKRIGDLEVSYPSDRQKYINTEPVANAMGLLIWRTTFDIPVTTRIKDDGNPVKAKADKRVRPPQDRVIKGSDGATAVVPETMFLETPKKK